MSTAQPPIPKISLVIPAYNERRSFGEDVELLFALKRVGRVRGQKLTRLRKVKAVAPARRPQVGMTGEGEGRSTSRSPGSAR